MANKTQR